jgi:hypothetical protein
VNACQDGDYYKVTFERSHKVGDEWETSPSYNLTDLPTLAKVAHMGSEKVHALQQNPTRMRPRRRVTRCGDDPFAAPTLWKNNITPRASTSSASE